MSTPANFNGKTPMIDPDDSAVLLIDHRSGLFQTVGDMDMTVLRTHVIALAKIATLIKIPVITTASLGRFNHELDQYARFGRSIVDYRLCARLSNGAACRQRGRLADERQ